MKRLSCVLVLLAILLLAGQLALSAQPLAAIRLYDGGAHNDWWSADSSRYVFYDAANADSLEDAVEISAPDWLAYHVATGVTDRSSRWPLQPRLTAEEEIAFSLTSSSAYLFQAPDERTLVFARSVAGSARPRWEIVIADSTIDTIVALPISVFTPLDGLRNLLVWWSDDSASFALQYLGDFGEPKIFLVRRSPEGAWASHSLHDFELRLQNRVFVPQSFPSEGVLDISPDGACVLLKSSEERAPAAIHLIVWCPENARDTRVLDSWDGMTILAGAFVQQDPSHLLLITPGGLMRYDTHENDTAMIDVAVNTGNLLHGLFSPDGAWLAYVTTEDDTYLLNIANSPGMSNKAR